jgi:hypothetical protein
LVVPTTGTGLIYINIGRANWFGTTTIVPQALVLSRSIFEKPVIMEWMKGK